MKNFRTGELLRTARHYRSEDSLMKSDEQLMQEYKNGSPESFEDLFGRYRNPIYGFFRRRLNNAARAEELAQETFLIILRGSDHYEVKARFRTYIYAIALKQLWSERRRESRQEKLAAQSPS